MCVLGRGLGSSAAPSLQSQRVRDVGSAGLAPAVGLRRASPWGGGEHPLGSSVLLGVLWVLQLVEGSGAVWWARFNGETVVVGLNEHG